MRLFIMLLVIVLRLLIGLSIVTANSSTVEKLPIDEGYNVRFAYALHFSETSGRILSRTLKVGPAASDTAGQFRIFTGVPTSIHS